MKRYWDTSALIEVLNNGELEKLSREPGQFTRSHSLAEMFSTLTGGKLGFKLAPDVATEAILGVTSGMDFVDLDSKEVFSALNRAQKHGIRGAGIHDWLHAVAAEKGKAEVLLTYNIKHFEPYGLGFDVKAP